MSTLNFLSPSYINDLDRLVLQRQSIRRFANCPVRHVVAVPARDMGAFRDRLSGDPGVTIRSQQEFVDRIFYAPAWSRWLMRALGQHGWRLQRSRYAGRPGWIVQQIVKLSVPEIFGDEAVVVVDSDVVFVRPFERCDFFSPGATRTLVRDEPKTEAARHRDHMRTARRLLGLPPGPDDHHYMAFPTVWYGDWVRALRTALERAQGRPWQRVLYDVGTFSEYLPYGVFVEDELHPPNLAVRNKPFHIGIWSESDMTAFLDDPSHFVASQPDDRLSLVVQSNLGVPVDVYRAAVDRLIT